MSSGPSGAACGPSACISGVLTIGLVGGRQGVMETKLPSPTQMSVGVMAALLLVPLGLANCLPFL